MHYLDAIGADPTRGRSYVEAASLYFALRRYHEARTTLEAATALGPSLYDAADRCEVHELLADLDLVRGDRESALGELERAVRLSNSVPSSRCSKVRFRLGYLRATSKSPKPETARALLTEFRERQCTKYLPSNTKAECSAATALLKELASEGRRSRQP
jgi:tetratricopeptide (TPR) repeat protein